MAATFLPYLMAFGWISICILLGVCIRAKVPLFQKMLMPSSIIAGVIGFILINLGWMVVPTPTGWESLKPSSFGVIVFHLFAIGFVGIGLLKSTGKTDNITHMKVMWRGSLWIALVFTLMYAIQSLFGFSIFSAWKSVNSDGANTIIGYLFGTGFTQGPGQTMAYASIWQSTPYNIPNAVNIGLTFAALGFFAATVVGVPIARYGLKKGWSSLNTTTELPDNFVKGIMGKDEQEACAHSITHPANIDTFAYHMAIVFVIYLLAYVFGIGWLRVMPAGVAPLGIGMLFLWGMLIAKLVRAAASSLHLDPLFDEATIRRFTGLCVDFMVAAVFMGIEFGAIKDMLIPIVFIVLVGTVVTAGVIIWYGRRAPELGFERLLFTFGTCTGTVATGLLLLRIVDPYFETSVAEEAGMTNLISTMTCTPIIYFGLPFAAMEGYPTFWIFVATLVIMPILLKILGLVRPRCF